MAFDFSDFLARIDPSQAYSITKLAGGVVNFTVRASKYGPRRASGGRFPEHNSFILKQAPPYVAGVGESATFSQFRQTIEARALSIFLPETQLLCSICTQSSVAVPKLLLHDEQENVLILSDLGHLPNLSDVFGALGGQISMASPTPTSVTENTLQRLLSFYVAIGEKIGSFFAHLHSSTSLAQIVGSPNRGEKFLYNPKTREVVHEFSIKPIKARLDSFPGILSATKAKVLFGRIEDDFLRQTQSDELALSLGDCWTGAILVDMNEGSQTVGVIDWEFACLGRGVNGDMSQLLAHLHLFKVVAEWRQDEALLRRIRALIYSITDAYRAQSTRQGSKWTSTLANPLNTFQATLMRSAFLAHGAEIINTAFWKVWVCEDKACGEPHPTETRDCRLIQRMMKIAVCYLDRAGQDEREFADTVKRDEVTDGSIMMPLFHCS